MVRLWPFALIAVAACGASGDESPHTALGAGKGDVALEAVIGPEWIIIGETAEGSFTSDLQSFGYQFRAAAGAIVSVEVTRTPGVGDLDSQLHVYGPGINPSSPELGFDDNSGYGKLSRIAGLPLPENSRYLIVVGTRNNRGRGNYKLKLTCDNDACLPSDIAVDCDAFGDVVHDCVTDNLSEMENDSCWIPPCFTQDHVDMAFDWCTSESNVDTLRDAVCGSHDPPVPGWCTDPIADFLANHWPTCKAQLWPPSVSDFVWDPD